MNLSEITTYLQKTQDELCNHFAQLDGQSDFVSDQWERPAGGGGITRILSNGAIFEKAAINFSAVKGQDLPQSASAQRPELAHARFFASGISMIFHPSNPYVPTMHANLRYFQAETLEQKTIWWFGGGLDLTPYYGFVADCQHWHQVIKSACEPFGEEVYPNYKKWCDEYFYLKHRQEARGIGGIFFDDLAQWGFASCFNFIQSIGACIIPAYSPIVEKRQATPFGEREKNFQAYRRGRYVEFNLIYDRGTLFGLQSGGRTESILASLPPTVQWQYNWQPQPGTPEAELSEKYLPPRDWV